MSSLKPSSLGAMSAFVVALAMPAAAQTSSDRATSTPASAKTYPAWAYPWDPNYTEAPADDELQRLPGSSAAFSWKQARDLFFTPDWHPDGRRIMPGVVSQGRRPDLRACGSCHRAERTGGPENANLAGLPAAYIVQQMKDVKSGARASSNPERRGSVLMALAAKSISDEEVVAAAEYFSALEPKQNIRVT